ncbi:hypothetical protein Tco_0664622 [Tanacetum coccineum]
MLLDEANMKKGGKLNTVLKKRDRGDDQDEDPSAGSNQGKKTKKRRFNESESSKKTSTTKESSKGKSLAKTSKSGKSVTAEEPVEDLVFEKSSDDVDQTFDDKVDDAGTCKSCAELEYNMEECFRPLMHQLDWANPEGHKIPVYLSKPLPLQDKEGRLVIPVEFFFNNDLEYLKVGNKERTYSSSITKTPAARYTMEGIEDMIPNRWSPVVHAYDKDAALGISH